MAAAQGIRQDEGFTRDMLNSDGDLAESCDKPDLPGAGGQDRIARPADCEGECAGYVVGFDDNLS